MNNWKIWNKKDDVEKRTYQRVRGELPEMECTKQLVSIVENIYTRNMKLLDVGCAAGHYYNGLRRIDEHIAYCGIDSTKAYIDYAQNYFKTNKNVTFDIQDIFDIEKKYEDSHDIVFSCNVLLHLPSISIPLKNLIKTAKKYVIIRTLISEKTHMSKLLYSDTFDEQGNPTDFVYQNTYSYNYIDSLVKEFGGYHYEIIDDEFNEESINLEFQKYRNEQDAVTKVQDGIQIAGSKVFEWKWLLIEKK